MKKIIRIIKKYIAFLNMNPDAVMSYVVRTGPDNFRRRIWINILLFILTLITTTVAGSGTLESVKEIIISGLPFSLTIMTILLSHEMGHFLAAKYFKVKATLPFFIPFPSIIGTMGAVIKLKSRIPSRKALLYIGAMGPLTGFVLSMIASIAGIYLSEIKPLPADSSGLIPVFGNSLLFKGLVWIIRGEIPAGYDIYLSPYAWAGWIGCFITSLNLMPIGQLDGSHILYALTGRFQLYIGWFMFAGLVILSIIWPGWIIWIILSLTLLKIGHPSVEDQTQLSAGERIIGWLCIIIFIVSFIPVPVNLL